jgi:hypothetical protein
MLGLGVLTACGGVEDLNTGQAALKTSAAAPTALTRGETVQIEVAIGEAICETKDDGADQRAGATLKPAQGVVGSSSATVVHGGRLVSSRERVLR